MTDCASTLSPAAEFLLSFDRKAFAARVPLIGSIELTARCNLRCVHCYLGDARSGAGAGEMSAQRLRDLIGEIADAGCLYLLITGGDPLQHPEFPGIYRHARAQGLVVTLFTNATVVGEPVLAALAEYPPQLIEVSIYGATAATHDSVTGVPGSFTACLAGVDTLTRAGLRVGLKTILMSVNVHEIAAMEALARSRDLSFRFDPAIFPRFDGDCGPLALRVPVGEVVALELADPVRLAGWEKLHARSLGWGASGRLYNCAAGVTAFHVDADGSLRPCLMVHTVRISLARGGFAEAWRDITAAIDAKVPGAAHDCLACERRFLCGYCPGQFALENGAEDRVSPYLCEMGTLRMEAIRS